MMGVLQNFGLLQITMGDENGPEDVEKKENWLNRADEAWDLIRILVSDELIPYSQIWIFHRGLGYAWDLFSQPNEPPVM